MRSEPEIVAKIKEDLKNLENKRETNNNLNAISKVVLRKKANQLVLTSTSSSENSLALPNNTNSSPQNIGKKRMHVEEFPSLYDISMDLLSIDKEFLEEVLNKQEPTRENILYVVQRKAELEVKRVELRL